MLYNAEKSEHLPINTNGRGNVDMDVYNINRDRVFMANKDQYKDRGAAEVFITGLYSP